MNHREWALFSRTAIAVAVAVVAAAPALAQNTTAAVSGRVVDAAGKAAAGAAVTIQHLDSGSTNNLVTDADGRYNARGLRVGGPYTITISKSGLVDKREGVFLALAETLTLNSQLGAGAGATVVVTGRGLGSDKFNSSSMGSGTSIGSRELNSLASIQRSLQDYARTDPRLAQTNKERGEISAMGQNSRFNSVTVDGVNISDTFGLEANTLPTAKQPISIDAIQSVQVNISNYDVTQKGYTGANINAISKSGTNDLRGSVYYVYRDQSMVGDRYNRLTDGYSKVAPFKESTTGITLGGPIVKDTLFFFLSYEELKSNRIQPGFGPVGSALTNVAITQAAINNIATTARTQYNFDIGTLDGRGQLDVKDTLVKLDWNISDSHRANLRFTRTEQGETNNGNFTNFPSFSATSLQTTSQWWLQKKSIDTVVGQWFADWTPDISSELKLSQRKYRSEPQNTSRFPFVNIAFSGLAPDGAPAGVSLGTRSLTLGTENSRHFNVLDTETVDAYFGVNWALGSHELKFGVDLADNQIYNAFFQNTLGNYTFNCTNSSATYTYNFNNNITNFNCGTAPAAQVEQAVLENFQRGRPSSYQVQVASPGRTFDDGIARWTLRNTGVFLQDTWKLSKDISVMAGVRMDQINVPDRPLFNAAAAAASVAGSVNNTTGGVTRNTGGFGRDNSVTVDGQQLFQPRIGFNWNLGTPESRKQLRGGFGLFQGAAANVWLGNPFQNAGLATRVIGCGTLGFPACPSTGGTFSANPDTQPTLPGTPPAANVDYLQDGLTQPSVWKANLAFETELPWFGLVGSAEWVFSKNKTAIYYQNLNLGGVTRTGADGRELYYTPQAYNPGCWSVSSTQATSAIVNNTPLCNTSNGQASARNRALANSSFNNVLLAATTNKGDGNALTLALSRPSRDGLSWQVAYTRTDATEVSPLTSSVSTSNFNSRSIFNPNDDTASTSAYLVRDRVSATASWSQAFIGTYRTSVGLFYEGRTGKPYSWTVRNDLNGDSVAGNDLMYIPSAPGSGEVEFVGATPAARQAAEDKFWSIVDTYKELGASKGGVVKRGGSFSAWTNNFDLRISQEVPGFTSKHKGKLSFDILNVGNLLNKRWGRINEMAFQSAGGDNRGFVSYAGLNAQGKYIYAVGDVDDVTTRQARGESQWALQITAKYEF